ncbi:MAG: diaminopimelate decarboxylase, partial [Intestinibacter sp.]|nr:diaminopimelate decarboxylase [Intestinibacter sp.]
LISDTEVGDIESGDILITTTTGAYGYAMASNYNKIPKNPVVFVKDGEDILSCKRQSYEDLLSLEV